MQGRYRVPTDWEHCHKPPLQIYCDSFRSIRECVCLCVYTYICIYALWQNNNSPIGNWQLAKDINTIIMEKKIQMSFIHVGKDTQTHS